MSKLVKQTELELKEKIMDALGRAVADGVLDEAPLPAFIIEVPKERQNGDYSTNVAMAGAKAFHKAPRVIAQAIVDRLDLADTVFDRAEIAGPGFINFFLGNRFYAAVLEDLMAQGENYGRSDYGKGKRVLVEFVSANPTGPMHIGNARGGAIGDCLAAVLDWAGYDVQREFYVNDAGNQIEKFATSLEVRYLQHYDPAVELPEGGALCAVSGGLDSMCLLEMTVRQGQKQGRRVAAAHFNHQLRGAEADRDEAFVRDWCAAREIPFFAGRGDVRAFAEKTGRTVEEAARQLRYKFLEETRRREGFGCILTAHHADDSAETMLLNLLRGTGLKGLTGIPEKRDCILRPLLSVTRAELAAYAAEHRIPFVEDSTNGTDDAARNMLRHQVLPVLKKLNPRVVENMSRTASLLTADEAALDAACRKLLAQCAVTPNVSGMIPLAVLQDAPEALRGRLVLAVLAAVAGHEKDLTAAHIRAVLTLDRGQLSMPYGVTVLREPAALRFFKAASAPAVQAVTVGETVTFGQWQVSLAESAGEGVLIFVPETADLTVTVWDSKDRLNGRTVKRLCGERGISPQERDRLPVLRVNGDPAAVPGLPIQENFAPDRYERAVRVIFLKVTEENNNE